MFNRDKQRAATQSIFMSSVHGLANTLARRSENGRETSLGRSRLLRGSNAMRAL